ncbi:MAG: hypothetical protein ACK5HY_11975 [Parahaliea sp.]
MKLNLLIATLLILPGMSYGQQTRYEYTGATIETVDAGTAYVLGGAVSGFIETSEPLAANLSNVNIAARITNWSFNDTVNTMAQGAGVFYDALGAGAQLIISTDATGNISAWNFHLYSPLPHNHDAPVNRIWLSFPNSRDEMINQAPCDVFPAAGTPCSTLHFGLGYSRASSSEAGQWQVIPTPLEPRAVPLLGPLAIVTLVVLLCGIGGTRTRPPRQRAAK